MFFAPIHKVHPDSVRRRLCSNQFCRAHGQQDTRMQARTQEEIRTNVSTDTYTRTWALARGATEEITEIEDFRFVPDAPVLDLDQLFHLAYSDQDRQACSQTDPGSLTGPPKHTSLMPACRQDTSSGTSSTTGSGGWLMSITFTAFVRSVITRARAARLCTARRASTAAAPRGGA